MQINPLNVATLLTRPRGLLLLSVADKRASVNAEMMTAGGWRRKGGCVTIRAMNDQLIRVLYEIRTLPEEQQQEYAAMIQERLDAEAIRFE